MNISAFISALLANVLLLFPVLAATPPEPPRVFLNTTYTPPNGRTITVNAGGDLQAALNSAAPGDIIVLQAGATFTGNFVLPYKTGSDWIVIRTSAPDSSLPPPGTRITPNHASVLPKIVTPNNLAALGAEKRAHHYRLIGVEIGLTSNYTSGLIRFGDGNETSVDQLANNLILDRCYIHGNNTGQVHNGIRLNSASTAIIDSYLANIHAVDYECHAIAGYFGPGPYKIVNNFLEASSINILFGGAVPPLNGVVPSDMEIRRNHFYKPLSWRRDDPTYGGTPWMCKNLFELKLAQRVLLDGNLFEHSWPSGDIADGAPQHGYAILFTVRSEGGGLPWGVVQDITFTNNIVRKANCGIRVYGNEARGNHRIKIVNNLLDDIGPRWGNNDKTGQAFQISDTTDLIMDHNTILQAGTLLWVYSTAVSGFTFTNNLAPHNREGVDSENTVPGTNTLERYFPGYVFLKNALAGGQAAAYPTNNFFPGSLDNIGFVDRAGGNYRLAANSAYKNAGTDGKDLGVDFTALAAAMNEVRPAPAVVSVSAASFKEAELSAEEIVSMFGANLATGTTGARTLPLPTTLLTTTVKVKDSRGAERDAPLFFVSPTQINYLVPAGTAAGAATLRVVKDGADVGAGQVQIAEVAPGLFAADASGKGLAAGYVQRVTASGAQSNEQIVRYDSAQNKFVAVPIELGATTDQVFLVLFGTGLRFRSSLAVAIATMGGRTADVTFAGAQGALAGLDQVNLKIPRELTGRGEIDVALTISGKAANVVKVNVR